ncbi:MAG TPA: hypothetical protein VIM62_12900 [Acidobacteriaceae bacterium]
MAPVLPSLGDQTALAGMALRYAERAQHETVAQHGRHAEILKHSR